MNAVKLLCEAGYSELACQFAAYIARQQQTEDPLVTLSAGLLSEAISDGHVCLNLHETPATQPMIAAVIPETSQWLMQLQRSEVVGSESEFKPLVLTENGLLYLYRYWQDEQQVAKSVLQRAKAVELPLDKPALQSFFANWNSQVPGIDWQKVAVLSALHQQLVVISGGPGTGKTTVVMNILRALNVLEQTTAHPLRVALAAPTGKAAARLQQAVNQGSEQIYEAKTLHRLLGITARHDQGRYSADRPLPVDVLIVDEASMIDISLMALLLKSLPVHARLILLGDAGQLASVESGAVLASLCAQATGFSDGFRQLAAELAALELADSSDKLPLQDCVIKLEHSYRFAAGGTVGQLVTAANQGNAVRLMDLLTEFDSWQLFSNEQLQRQLTEGYQHYISAVESEKSVPECLSTFEQFRVLCAMRQGPQSVLAVNIMMERLLARRGWRTSQPYYAGRPIMVTQNDYRQQLFNGDVGIILVDASGELKAWFQFAGELRQIPLSRLPAHETVFAMTIHKSQGSEFDAILLLMPEEDNALLGRELVYTALSRARQSVSVMASANVLQWSLQRKLERQSGLERLINHPDEAVAR
ncbi:MAG: exodeoxyribonuclease V subunit alpha [Methylophaga sp.]|nr:exodeoxyribonuclease V subunit alpha [Methylophaga sp.]